VQKIEIKILRIKMEAQPIALRVQAEVFCLVGICKTAKINGLKLKRERLEEKVAIKICAGYR
jgi:hypothetical protein